MSESIKLARIRARIGRMVTTNRIPLGIAKELMTLIEGEVSPDHLSQVACEEELADWVERVKRMNFGDFVEACQPVNVWRAAWRACTRRKG
jgi:hypothetical protein